MLGKLITKTMLLMLDFFDKQKIKFNTNKP